MEDRTRRMLVGLAFAAGAIALSATTAGAQSDSSGGSSAPKATTTATADNGPSSGDSMPGGCSGMHMPDTGGTGTTTAANLT